ncbi:MAG: flagellar basal-body rod protein FlgG [Planctomycetota bacterium]|nr:flagellar basal-body rod protein FlgG [Planctomycetota bacterium]MDA1214670.1 flagellar basal-body rod protein FlgG [Planctomycetota bacterium]
MPIRALNSGATGMSANMFNLDVIANNLANSGTTAFKRSRANFEDMIYQQLKLPGTQTTQGQLTSVGLGTRLQSTQLDFVTGTPVTTGRPLDLMINGEGFFGVTDGTQVSYTRAGNLTVNDSGNLVIASADVGRLLDPPITIPQNAINISVSADGVVSYMQQGTPDPIQAGTINLYRFINPQGLIQQGDNIYLQSPASGPAQLSNPGQDGAGIITQGFLESSNVEPVRELVELIKTQRNFELNSQTVQAADQALQLIANLRRF